MILSFLLALSLSLDALGAGMACGLRRISLPIFPVWFWDWKRLRCCFFFSKLVPF